MTDIEREGFERGTDFMFRVMDRRAKQYAADLALQVLGKDRADGVIDLGALGRWIVGPDGGRAQEGLTRDEVAAIVGDYPEDDVPGF